jgi:hypothetical protein
MITIGDGKSTPFWEACWLNGVAPKELAPNLYDQTRFKHRSVRKEMQNCNWVKNITHINFETLMDEFILLFATLNGIHLCEDKDTIHWI